ncbi:MAG: RagB/SusD family nutrient uptake outer membrane protein [Tannerellaceae bacterium]|nr:RagB/SusD family nutrient uptake outer membrane protein [Tannerellaceae bacterium]
MKYKQLFISLICCLGLVSCNDFLDHMPTGNLTSESGLSSAESAEALANSAYIRSAVFNRMVSGWGSNSVLLLEYMTDKATSENSQSNYKDFEGLTVSARTSYLEDWWVGCYAGIADCNLALNKLEEFTGLDKEVLEKYRGEIRFWRAMYYFYLVRIFGDVTEILHVQSELGELQVTRDPVKEIYDEIIIPDLLSAEQAPLPVKEETGRVSLNAVRTLLADVYLTYAGYPVQGGSQYYAESAKRTLAVIESQSYTLFPSYESLWDPANNNRGEFIFQIQYGVNMDKVVGPNQKIVGSNEAVCVMLPTRSGMSAFNLEYGSLVPRKEFVESFTPGDKRVEEKQFFFTTYKGHPNKFATGAPELEFMDFGGYYIHKFFDKQAIDVVGQSDLNWTIYRYADVLLLYAEAQVNADEAANSRALDALNQIRTRAGLEPFTVTDKSRFEKAVWDQRYFELCYENKMWFDILRTRLIRQDATGEYVPFVGYQSYNGKTYGETQLLFPILLREMQANFNMQQNPGY